MAARVGIWTRWADRKESPFLSQPPLNKFDAPFLSQASFVNGVLDGEWLIFDAKQRKCSAGLSQQRQATRAGSDVGSGW